MTFPGPAVFDVIPLGHMDLDIRGACDRGGGLIMLERKGESLLRLTHLALPALRPVVASPDMKLSYFVVSVSLWSLLLMRDAANSAQALSILLLL